ncbi:MAG: formate/nitrite transporter family protein [Anaerolineae bacterium]
MLTERAAPQDGAKKPAEAILSEQIEEEVEQIERNGWSLFLSGTSAGFELGFSVFLMGVMLTVTGDTLAEPISRVLVASVYAIGYIFVILGRSELFTEHTTQAVLPVLDRQASWRGLARLWAIIYVANLIGGTVFAALAAWIGPALHVVEPSAFGVIAGWVVDYPWWVIFVSGILAGWMMGLLTWLVVAGRDTIGQVVCVWIVTFAIGFAHLHHSIAGTIEAMAGFFSGQAVTMPQIAVFLAFATLGNAVGGVVFVALFKYGQISMLAAEQKATGRE